MTEWKPIETAPKDQELWLYDPEISPPQFVGGFQHTMLPKDDPDYWEGWVFSEDLLANGGYEPQPTHWMPIPPPPSTPAA